MVGIPTRGLNPQVVINGEAQILTVAFSGAVPRSEIEAPIGSCAHRRDEIIRAPGLLLTGV